MSEVEPVKIAVIGCGNANRNDDGAGLEVVRQLKAHAALADDDRVQLLDAGTDGMAVMFAARGCTSLFIIDACRIGDTPGTLYEVPGEKLEAEKPHTLNLHDFRWDHALFAGRQIYADAFPKDVVAFLIEAHDVNYGTELTSEVRAGATRAAGLVADRVKARLAGLDRGGSSP